MMHFMPKESTLFLGQVAEVLAGRLNHEDARVRRRAARSLGFLGEAGAEVAPLLAEASLEDPDSDVRAEAVNALERLGTPERVLFDTALAMLRHPRADVRARAGWAIGKLDPDLAVEALPALAERIDVDEAIDGRFGATWAAARIRSDDPEALHMLVAALADAESDVRAEAARALGETGAAAVPVLPALSALLADPDPLAREQAARALGRIGSPAPELVHGLQDLLADPFDYVRAAAAEALAGLGAAAVPGDPATGGNGRAAEAPAIDELLARLADGSDFSRTEAAWLLAKHGAAAGGQATEILLVQAFGDRDSDARWSALHALGRIGRRSPALTRAVALAAAADEDPDVRAKAVEVLGWFRDEAPTVAVEALVRALGDADPLVRAEAASSLGALGPAATEALPALRKAAAADTHAGVRARAETAVAAVDSQHLPR
jgi:HEAT repeat protein